MENKVYLNSISHYNIDDILENLREASKYLNLEESFKKGETLLLKPNYLTGTKIGKKPVITESKIIEATIIFFKELGLKISIGDSPALESFRKIAQKSGLFEICSRYGVEIVEFKEKKEFELPDFSTIKKVNLASEIFNFDHIVNLPKLKTHSMMGLTLGIKNMFGVVIGKEKAKNHLNSGEDREIFAKLMLAIYVKTAPHLTHLTILDGISGMEGNGPSNGDERNFGIFAISKDAITLDAVTSKILNFPEEKNHILKAAKEIFPNKCDLKNVKTFPKNISQFKVENLRMPKMGDCRWQLPQSLANFLRDIVSPKLKIDTNRCIMCKKCVEVCPTNSILEKKNHLKINSKSCIRCFCCQEICPENAIFVKESIL